MDNARVLGEIIETMGDSESKPTTPIARDLVLRWMQSADIEILGATYALISDVHHLSRIDPPLSLADTHPFMRHYYDRCLREDPDGEWSDSRYSAGWDLVSWFGSLWKDPAVPRQVLKDFKEWLATLYREGDKDLRECIVTATLEHICEDPNIAKYFADWKLDPELEVAYRKAMLWSEKLD